MRLIGALGAAFWLEDLLLWLVLLGQEARTSVRLHQLIVLLHYELVSLFKSHNLIIIPAAVAIKQSVGFLNK